MTRATRCCTLLLIAILLGVSTFPLLASDKKSSDVMSKIQRDEALQMLQDTAEKVRQQYYDPTFHAQNFEGRYKEAEQRIRKADTLSEAFGVIAWFLDGLNDSHTFFIPPARPYLVEDGWEAKFVGEICVVTAVKDKSDASSKGLKPGDQILAIEGFRPTRANWWKLTYAFHTLSPRSGMKLAVVSPGEQPRELTVMSTVKNLPKNYDLSNGIDIWNLIRSSQNDEERNWAATAEQGDLLIWKLPRFMLTDDQIDAFLKKANNHKAVVIDLRGNPGGAEENLSRLLGGVFDHDVKVGDRIERKSAKPFVAKSRGGRAYSGKLIVLVDSGSASAAELFARVVQLEKRGTVIGDRSAGAVMEAREFPFTQGAAFGEFLPYGVEVTIADLKMTDGNSLEHHGVVPDEILLPSPEELAVGADPQLARACQLAGLPISSSAAGQIFPVRWR
jgi:C-terminal processing protease CtpA/Prc